jgi:hypothetical protein
LSGGGSVPTQRPECRHGWSSGQGAPYTHSCSVIVPTGATSLRLYATVPIDELGTVYIDNVKFTGS